MDNPNLASPQSRRTMITRTGTMAALGALAATTASTGTARADSPNIDVGILNFALNLEYLEAEFYARAAFGRGLRDFVPNIGPQVPVTGGRQVAFATPWIQLFAQEIARDEIAHVKFLSSALGSSAVNEPAIDFTNAFRTLGNLVGVQNFDPFADEISFLLGAYIFEDVGVTAYSGAAPLVTNKTYLGAAGILAVEAYHASAIRGLLIQNNQSTVAGRIADLRASLSGTGGNTGKPADDQGPIKQGLINVVPADTNAIAFARTPQQVLSIVYFGGAGSGGFFPQGVQGMFTTSH